MLVNDIPSEQKCIDVNRPLFNLFREKMIENGKLPTENWTEAEVVQYLDIELNVKYQYEKVALETR